MCEVKVTVIFCGRSWFDYIDQIGKDLSEYIQVIWSCMSSKVDFNNVDMMTLLFNIISYNIPSVNHRTASVMISIILRIGIPIV